MGNIALEPLHFVNAGIKKRFGENFTLSCKVANLIENTTHIITRNEQFVRRMTLKQPWMNRHYQIGLTYNFKSGKAFRQKSIESGSASEKSRLK